MISLLLNKTKNISIITFQLGSVLLAMLLAAQIQYIQHGWINPDSVLYFESARLFALGEWQQGFKVFQWPLYALLIAFTHQITTLEIQTSAQLLSMIFFGITTASFLKIIELAGGGKNVMCAGILILFSSNYLVGDVLEMLMRDQGFWAFFLMSLVFFIRFYKNRNYLDAFFWQVYMITATLFRIEGITYLIALPLMLFFDQKQLLAQSVIDFLKSNFLNISLIILMIAALMLNIIPIESFGRLNEILTINDQLTEKLFAQSAIMGTHVLGQYLDEFALPGILLTFVYVLIIKTIHATGYVNVGLAVLTIRSKPALLDDKVAKVLNIAAVIALINMALIITKVFVLSGRYVLALSLILMIFASFYFGAIFKHLQTSSQTNKKMKWLVIALIAFMSLSLVKNILPKRDGYNYVQDAVTWLNAKNSSKKPVFYDDTRARYYAGAPFIGTWEDNWAILKKSIENGDIHQYEYLVINHALKHSDREQQLAQKIPQFTPIKKFSDANHKKSIVIYQRNTSR
ncbi:MAG: hypothetical protein CTY33_02220 [Methylotenera sp.]|nr:MAG: hypothetical protein CTY33_02220 [Methylotenera sp.]